ncbi:hypothetical protein SOJ52_26875, partial [Pseudomonas aeruginosa]|nr:hypothetical protein [Pseudomonas aeruginosa]
SPKSVSGISRPLHSALTEAALFGRIRLREEACSRASGMPSSHLGN